MRFIFLALFFTVLFTLLSFNLYRVQVDKGFYYFEKAQARNEALQQLQLRRGQIFFTDKYGTDIPVAMQSDFPVIYAVPSEIANPKEVAHTLAPIVKIEEEKLAKDIDNPQSKFRLLVDMASGEMIADVQGLNIKGIYTDTKQYRSYPFESLGSHIIGYVGLTKDSAEPTGLYGLEKMDNKKLSEGERVRLSIDRNLQAESEQALNALIKEFDASGGTVIIQESSTGKIITLANAPDFNPNIYFDFPIKNFPNPAVQYVYEPGSVFKPITMSAGIDMGAITPDTTFVDTGSVTLNGFTVRNWDLEAHGKITMTNVIEKSVNTGAIFAEQKIGDKNFLEFLKRFGFGEETGIDLPDEVSGSLQNLEKKQTYAIDFATASYGQGVSVTPVQMITAFSAIANGGLLMKPFIEQDIKPTVIRRVMKEETSREVIGMMESAVDKARIAAIPHYRIAGKTGTAFIPENGKYSKEDLIQTFIGFLPASNPRYTILIKLNKPNAELAGYTVVPAFHDLASFVINYFNIPPDRPISQ